MAKHPLHPGKTLQELRDPEIDQAMLTAMEGWRWADAFISDELRKAKNAGVGEEVCTGCEVASCCRQVVMCTWLDALPIALTMVGVRKNTPDFRRWLRTVGENQEQHLVEGEDEDRDFPCPFLRDGPLLEGSPLPPTEKCIVHAVRPMICRTYFAFKDRDACTPYQERTDGQRPTVSALDHGPAVDAALNVCAQLEAKLAPGFMDHTERRAPARPLATQVAVVLEGLDYTGRERWEYIIANGSLSAERIRAMYEKRMKEGRVPQRREITGSPP